MTYRPMPDWIQPYKNLWLSQGKIKELFTIEDQSFGSWFESVKLRVSFIEEESKNKIGTVRRYRVKHVWAMALAHGITLLPSDKTLPEEALRIEVNSLRKKLDYERKQVRIQVLEVDSAPESVEMIQLLVQCTEARPVPGIYFLMDKSGEVIYVGQSGNVLGRMVGHQEKPFHTVKMIQIKDEKKRLEIEAKFIKLLAPRLNINGLGFRRELASARASVAIS